MINQITLVGFLGRDAQKKALPNGTPVLNFSLATKKVWKDSNNEWQERTQWHQVVLVTACPKLLPPGSSGLGLKPCYCADAAKAQQQVTHGREVRGPFQKVDNLALPLVKHRFRFT
jgi:hypothetical protein